MSIMVGCQSIMPYADVTERTRDKAEKYLIKDQTLDSMFSITHEGVRMLRSPEENNKLAEEIYLPWDQADAFIDHISRLSPDEALDYYLNFNSATEIVPSTAPTVSPDFPVTSANQPVLSGVRIALDPGHIGGEMHMAELEGRYIKILHEQADHSKHTVQFNEGNLTYATALLLQQSLTKLGAEVMITRNNYGVTSFGYDYKTWKETRFEHVFKEFVTEHKLTPPQIAWWQDEASDGQVFHGIFNWDEFRNRAKKIDRFRPHLTLIIHYNADPTDAADKQGYFSPVDSDFNMAFIPGSFMTDELNDPNSRLAWLRLLLSNQIDQSLNFCTEIVDALERETGVSVIQSDRGISYLEKASLSTPTQGVYARNLAMTRRVRGTLCFAESLYEDNASESLRLADTDLLVGGKQVSSRVQDVARAYLKAITAFTDRRYSHP
ncbi:MAG: hypothetical protein GY792_36355 [Gammaproteobacteria bacterium]|nr:hypothetical protein [Gammaproteobacteria bacterium]